MTELQVFKKDGLSVRVIDRDGEPWWIAKDVCQAIGLLNPRDAVGSLDPDERGSEIATTPGGQQELTVINEAGLYSLLWKSHKPEARQFQRWMTHEVLPSIRKTGSYGAQQAPPADEATTLVMAKLAHVRPMLETIASDPDQHMPRQVPRPMRTAVELTELCRLMRGTSPATALAGSLPDTDARYAEYEESELPPATEEGRHKVMRALSASSGRQLNLTRLAKRTQALQTDERHAVLNSLVASGHVRMEERLTRGRPICLVSLV